MNGEFYIYVHSRIKNGEPFYVGKGKGNRHLVSSRDNRGWTAIVAKDGGFHSTLLKSGVDEDFALLIEMEVIDRYRRFGVKLVNTTYGGPGVSGMRHTAEAKAKIGKASKGNTNCLGRKLSPEHIAKMSAASAGNKHAAGYKHTPEAIGKISATSSARLAGNKIWLGRKHSPESRAKIALAKIGNTASSSPEAKEKIRAANIGNKRCLGYKHTEAARANMSAAHLGKGGGPMSAESRAKISAALRASWQRRKGNG